jgi:ketosteroid isomerase-like protein
MRRALAVPALVAAASLLGACSLWPFGSGSADAVPSAPARERSGLQKEADRLLEADRAFASQAVEYGAAEAFAQFFDGQGVRLAVAGDPAVGPDSVRALLKGGPARILSWEPRYAEVFASGNWGWTWGDWEAHEPGAGGRRVAEGRYLNVWKKQADGRWKVRADLRSGED